MRRQPIYDDNGKIVGSFDPDFLANLPDVLYRLIKYQCTECGSEFLMDARHVKESGCPYMNCPECGEKAEEIAATRDDLSHKLSEWGCVYPNPLTYEEERKWLEEHRGSDADVTRG